MAYKKYIIKNGKQYGPYTYHSKRVNGKVVSEYHGKKNEIGSNFNFGFNKNYLWIFLGLIVAITLIYFGANCIKNGTCQYYTSTYITDPFANSIAAKMLSSTVPTSLFKILRGEAPEAGSSFSWDEEEIKVEEFGVKINSFKPDLAVYSVEEPIEVIADMKVKSPLDYDIVINFDKSCDNQFKPSTSKDYTIYAGKEESLSVSCESPTGYTEDEVFKGADSEKQIVTKQITFAPSYDLAQEVTLNVITKNNKLKEDQIIGKIRSVKQGPMTLELSSTNSQPFYTGDINHIYLTLTNNPLVWNGNLKELKELILYIPNSIELLSEGDEDSKFCDFEKESTEDDYTIYSLKSELMDKINKLDCSITETYSPFGSKQDCLDKARETFRFTCKFKVIEAEEEASQISPLKSKVEYTYGIKKVASIGIIKSKPITKA